jgi:hypothetical protein
MTTSDQEDQAERRRILREQGATFLDHARAAADEEAQGRFQKVNATTVIGSTPIQYPPLPASSPWHGRDPVPDEPALGYSVDALDPASPTGVSAVFPPVAPGDPVHAPSGGSLVQQPNGGSVSERAGSSLSSEEQTK